MVMILRFRTPPIPQSHVPRSRVACPAFVTIELKRARILTPGVLQGEADKTMQTLCVHAAAPAISGKREKA
jgi:hypothetical protein